MLYLRLVMDSKKIERMIKDLLIENPNYKDGYYFNKGSFDVITDVKERANYILNEIKKIETVPLNQRA